MIFQKGCKLNKIAICLEGTVSGRPPGTVISEDCIKTGCIVTKDMIKEGSGMVSVISLDELHKVLGKSIQDIVHKNYVVTHEKMMAQ